ncbi:cystathionine beta-synthase [Venturia canescens]|uniref:cystathionine beta-synthase n=1 Tax=Venturia canescens TaxID=32260 RepID=UPI001C9D2542|nr:cystathionine beta-synthase [Venturia canescens]
MELDLPNRPSTCTWSINAKDSPHTKRDETSNRNKILPDILHAIGQTPMVRLNNITKLHGIKCEMYAKCEYFNPGGSVKDRIGYRMVLDAEAKGILKPGCTIIEPTSGNTGIGLAMAAAVRGYRCIIVMPEKMSNEKLYTLKALGAEIIRTPTEASWDSEEGHIATSQKLRSQIPNSVILDQYTNPGNPLAHYDGTATEILEQCDGKIDYFVGGAGTGGTISGIGRKLKEMSPETKIIAVDPEGSILADIDESDAEASSIKFYEVEGIGYDFIPTVLDRNVIDNWVKSNDHEAFTIVRELIKTEGLLCGGSSGSALSVALKLAKDLPAEKRVVVLLPDGIRNYMTKFVSDHWMEARGFADVPQPVESNKWWWNLHISNLNITKGMSLPQSATCQEALNLLESEKLERIPITSDNFIKGLVTLHTLMSRLIAGSVKKSDPATEVIQRQFLKVCRMTTLARLSRILETDAFVVVVDEHDHGHFIGLVTQKDLFNFISKGAQPCTNGNA